MIVVVRFMYVAVRFVVTNSIDGGGPLSLVGGRIPNCAATLKARSSTTAVPIGLRYTGGSNIDTRVHGFMIPLYTGVRVTNSVVAVATYTATMYLVGRLPVDLTAIVPFVVALNITVITSPKTPNKSVVATLPFLCVMFNAATKSAGKPVYTLVITLCVARSSFKATYGVSKSGTVKVIMSSVCGGFVLGRSAIRTWFVSFVDTFSIVKPGVVNPSDSRATKTTEVTFLTEGVLGNALGGIRFALCKSFTGACRKRKASHTLLNKVVKFKASSVEVHSSFRVTGSVKLSFSFMPGRVRASVRPGAISVLVAGRGKSRVLVHKRSLNNKGTEVYHVGSMRISFAKRCDALVIVRGSGPNIIACVAGYLDSRSIGVTFVHLFERSGKGATCSVIRSSNLLPRGVTRRVEGDPGISSIVVVRL